MRDLFKPIYLLTALLILAGCSSSLPESQSRAGFSSNVPLSQGQNDDTLVYRNPNLNLANYNGLYIEPGQLYRGSDADFGDAPNQEKAEMALFLSEEFRRVLSQKHNVVSQPGPHIAKLRLTLIGYKESRPVLSTGLRVTPVGAVMTLGKSVVGLPAFFTGSATFSGEITDSLTGEVLGAFVTKHSPPAYDLTSGLGRTRAARIAITEGAQSFSEALSRLKGAAR